MTAIYWQLSIFATIALASLLVIQSVLPSRSLLIVCGIWTLHTLVQLTPPLMVVQLVVIWVSYSIFSYIVAKRAETINLRQELAVLTAALSEEQRNNIATIPEESMQILSGVEHRDYLFKSLRSTEHKIMILSGWISSRVIDEQFVSLLALKLGQGVHVYIGYGWENSKGKHSQSVISKEALASLKRITRQHPKAIFVSKFATHEKLLVLDEKKVVYGSANWLCNRSYKNSERSIVIADDGLAKGEAERVEKLIRQNVFR